MESTHLGRATDNLGPHLLKRNPMPEDSRDFKIEDYLGAYHRMQASYEPGMTLQQVADAHDLTKWHDVYAFWAWFKKEFLSGNNPAPTPTPTPTPIPTPSGAVIWTIGPISDQGQSGMCVGFTGLDWGNCLPVNDQWPNTKGQDIYYQCVPSDKGKPIGQEQGSDSRTLCKVLKANGRIGAYAFSTDVETAISFVQGHGPVGTGIEWDNDMFTPDKDFYVRPGGGAAGGHELLFNGFDPSGFNNVKEESFTFPNHWGVSWADKGTARITAQDWQDLIHSRQMPGDIWAGLENPLAQLSFAKV